MQTKTAEREKALLKEAEELGINLQVIPGSVTYTNTSGVELAPGLMIRFELPENTPASKVVALMDILRMFYGPMLLDLPTEGSIYSYVVEVREEMVLEDIPVGEFLATHEEVEVGFRTNIRAN